MAHTGDYDIDITAELRRRGLPNFKRPEHVEIEFVSKMKRKADEAHRKGKPFISAATNNVLKHFGPRQSSRFSQDPEKAQQFLTRSGGFQDTVHLLRHVVTWGLTHVAAGALDVPSLFWFMLDILEIADAHGFQYAKTYSLTRLNKLKEAVDTFEVPGSVDEDARESSKRYLGDFLRSADTQLEQATLLGHLPRQPAPKADALPGPLARAWPDGTEERANATGSSHFEGGPKGNDEPKHKRQRGIETQICFNEDWARGWKCKDETCKRIHLDTRIAEDRERYARATSLSNKRSGGRR